MFTRSLEEVTKAAGSNAWLRKIKQLSDPLGESDKTEIRLPEHVERGWSMEQQCNDIATFISKISREYQPLSLERLPQRVVDALESAACSNHPVLEDHQVYKIMMDRKLTSGVAGDLHPAVMKEFMIELTQPVGVFCVTLSLPILVPSSGSWSTKL